MGIGNSCAKKDKKIIRKKSTKHRTITTPTQPTKPTAQIKPLEKKNSVIMINEGNDNPYTDVHCPIDNLDITDSREEVKRQNPFKNSLQWDVKASHSWHQIQYFKTNPDEKYWFYGQLSQGKIGGDGIIFYQGKYSEYIVQGTFANHKVIPDKNYLKIFGNGNTYLGTLNSNLQPDGVGQMVYGKKEKYHGHFQFGLPHGCGMKTSTKLEFKGFFEKGEKKHGSQKEEKGTYEGQFKDNMKDGEGIFTSQKGERYVGQYKKNKRNGYGRLFNSKGDIVYKGFWRDDVKSRT